ncbi:MAG: hypothetical protein ACI89X_003690 [Planctomycetota bacterium]|jgi:hypothetical protein
MQGPCSPETEPHLGSKSFVDCPKADDIGQTRAPTASGRVCGQGVNGCLHSIDCEPTFAPLMAQKNSKVGFSIADGFRLGLGFAIANAFIALLGAVIWFMVLAGLFGTSTMSQG